MKLDIIIPCYNEEQNISSLLPYLKDSSSKKFINITIVDASESSDNSRIICEQYGVSYLQSDETQRSKQMNYGADNTDGDVILFLHADVRPPKGYYKFIAEAIEDNNQCGSFAYKFDSDKLLLKVNAFFTRFKGFFTGGGDQGLYITREAFNDLDGYCVKHIIMEDFDLYNRIKEKGYQFKIINAKAVVSARKYAENSWLRVNLVNLIAIIKYKVNQDPKLIKSFYRNWLNT